MVRGAHEAWTVAPRLARNDIAAIVTPRNTVDADELYNRETGSTIQNAAILYDHGSRVSYVPVGGWFGRYFVGSGRDRAQGVGEQLFAHAWVISRHQFLDQLRHLPTGKAVLAYHLCSRLLLTRRQANQLLCHGRSQKTQTEILLGLVIQLLGQT